MKYAINLLAEKETPFLERMMYFSLNYLRYIIIITQLVVIGVFFYRFQIDQQIIDLRESVDQKKEIIQVVLPLLKEAEKIDKQTVASKNIFKTQQKFSATIQYFLSVFPASLLLSKLEIDGGAVKATGDTNDIHNLQVFYLLLKKEQRFEKVELQSIKKTDIGYSFVLYLNNFKSS